MTRLRVQLTGSSDWQSLKMVGGWIGELKTLSVSSGARMSRGGDYVSVIGSGAQSGVFYLVYEASWADTFSFELSKGSSGTARAIVTRENATNTVIADITNSHQGGSPTVRRSIPRSSVVGEGLTIPRVDPRRLVLAFYYPWVNWNTFESGNWYDTPSSAYDTNNQSAVNSMVAQAAGAGVDGFVVSWDDVGNHTQRFDMVMNAAANRNFYVTPMIELLAFKNSSGAFDGPRIEATIKKALERSASPKFLSVAGRPVVFVIGAYHIGSTQWRTIVANLAASGSSPFFLGESGDLNYRFDGAYLYSPNHKDYDALANHHGTKSRLVRYPAMLDPSIRQGLYAASVSPGYDGRYFDRFQPNSQPRNDGKRYDLTWQAALPSQPEWMLVTSWNEWWEATHISPSRKHGYQALDQTRDWAGYFKNPAPAGGGSTSTEPSGGSGLLSRIPVRL